MTDLTSTSSDAVADAIAEKYATEIASAKEDGYTVVLTPDGYLIAVKGVKEDKDWRWQEAVYVLRDHKDYIVIAEDVEPAGFSTYEEPYAGWLNNPDRQSVL